MITSAGTVKITPDAIEVPAEAPVCTMLFSRMPPPPSARSTAIETTAAGMAEAGYDVLNDVVLNVDRAMDLHAGDMVEALEPFLGYQMTGNAEVDARSREMIEAYVGARWVTHVLPGGERAGMLYGAACSLVIALVAGKPLGFEWSASYVASLLYLAVFGSVSAFAGYLTLPERIGPARAAYIGVMVPIVALVISALFEGYTWRTQTWLGIALSMTGNVIILRRMK